MLFCGGLGEVVAKVKSAINTRLTSPKSGKNRKMTFISLARKLPDPISDELSGQGHSVHECLSIGEVFALAEEHFDAQIVIAADMEERWATKIQTHYPTLHLKPSATAKDILWELGLKGAKVQ